MPAAAAPMPAVVVSARAVVAPPHAEAGRGPDHAR